MNRGAPIFDRRTAAEVTAQIRQLLARGDTPLPADPLRDALVAVAARYCELVIDRLNQVPWKNFVAFLDLLGAAQMPPQPARVPLTFSLAAGATLPAIVPAGTQVAAAPMAGETDPVLFETGRDLVVLPVRVTAVFARDPRTKDCVDLSGVVGATGAPEGLAVFVPPGPGERHLYLGFELAGATGFPNGPVSLFLKTSDPVFESREPGAPAEAPVRLAWEYRSATGWAPLLVEDGTQALARTGMLEFLAPPDMAVAGEDFDLRVRYWIRARRESGTCAVEPRLVRVLANTTMASQGTTVRDEVLGSSDGSKNQRFASTRSPILPGQQMEVREPELPSATERSLLHAEEGVDAILPAADGPGGTRDWWVRWHEVPDFYASDARSRHYVVDRLRGAILFGDGRNGLVPPVGVGNIRLARYETGGGRAGNRPAGTIVQLRTTVPYVDKVTNPEPATGGADVEPLEAVTDRVPRQVRHGGRAVTTEDHEDLAREASPEVARARCVRVPDADLKKESRVLVIVVPHSADAQPQPSVELVRRVQDYLETRCAATARMSVAGPTYLPVTVAAEIVPTSPQAAPAAIAAAQQRVRAFLHPLTGGFDGAGWRFGAQPRDVDLYTVIGGVPGVDHVGWLKVDTDPAAVRATFLMSAGTVTVTAVSQEAA